MSPVLTPGDGVLWTWQRLLTHICKVEGEKGIQRIFVKVPEHEGDAIDVFRHTGFGVYTQEHLFRLPQLMPELNPQAVPLRLQEEKDAWDLQRLYFLAAPRLVQQTECPDNNVWDNSTSAWLKGVRDERYVWEREGTLYGYVRLLRGRRGHWLKVLAHPDIQEEADDLVRWALALLNSFPPRPIYTSVRGYESGLQIALKRSGFQPQNTLFLLVKHTTALVREPEFKPIPALERKVETAPTASHAESILVRAYPKSGWDGSSTPVPAGFSERH
ncbi:MAG: hypothetical protein A2Z04_06345 [Chloroflexi bacterium RBG_16_57_9]|nr:MAG: hypothetical protein A2Z04_06345 [Chloroflexi bacterium RBG_16_57_9]